MQQPDLACNTPQEKNSSGIVTRMPVQLIQPVLCMALHHTVHTVLATNAQHRVAFC